MTAGIKKKGIKMKEKAETIIGVVIFAIIIGVAFYVGTSKEFWYVDKHDSKCDLTENCGCYERFIKEGE